MFCIYPAVRHLFDINDGEEYMNGWDKYTDTWNEYKKEIKKHYPEYYHTLEWDEHPEDFDEPCFCATCRSYMVEDA